MPLQEKKDEQACDSRMYNFVSKRPVNLSFCRPLLTSLSIPFSNDRHREERLDLSLLMMESVNRGTAADKLVSSHGQLFLLVHSIHRSAKTRKRMNGASMKGIDQVRLAHGTGR